MAATVTAPSSFLFHATGVDVLVADDDPASRRFLADGMGRLDAARERGMTAKPT